MLRNLSERTGHDNQSPRSRSGGPNPSWSLIGPAPAALTGATFLLLRVVLAVIFFAHGWDTIQNLGVSGTVALQRESGVPLPEVAGPFTVYAELIGAPLLAFGVLTRLAAAALAGLMAGAFAFIHAPNGIFVENGGFELVLVLGAACVLFAFLGAGRYSVDTLIASRRSRGARTSTGNRS